MSRNYGSTGKEIIILYSVVIISILLSLVSFGLNLLPSKKIAYINTQLLMTDYLAVKDAQVKINSKNKEQLANIDTLTIEFQRELINYEKSKAGLTNTEQKLREEILVGKKNKLEQYQRVVTQKLQQDEIKMTQEILESVNLQVQGFGKQNSYSIIFGTNGGNIIYGEESIDITKQIIDLLNDNYLKANK